MEPLPIRCCNLSLFQLQSCATEAFIGYGFAAQARQLKGSVVSNEGACGRQRNKKPWFKNDARMLEPVPNVYFKQLVLFQWMKTAEHWKRSLKFTNSLNLPVIYAYICTYMCCIYIYSISPFCACFFSFFPSSFHFSSRRRFIPQLSPRNGGANLTTSTLTAQGTMTIDQVDVQNLARLVDWATSKANGVTLAACLARWAWGPDTFPPQTCAEGGRFVVGSVLVLVVFLETKIWRAAKETLIGVGYGELLYGNVRIFISMIPKTIWTFSF